MVRVSEKRSKTPLNQYADDPSNLMFVLSSVLFSSLSPKLQVNRVTSNCEWLGFYMLQCDSVLRQTLNYHISLKGRSANNPLIPCLSSLLIHPSSPRTIIFMTYKWTSLYLMALEKSGLT